MLNANSPAVTAFIRGLYGAALGFAGTFLMTYGQTDDMKSSLIIAGTAACIALGWRSGVEGTADSRRNAKGKVLPGDVTPNV